MDENNIIVGGGQKPTQKQNITNKAAEAGIPEQFMDTEFPVPTEEVELPSGGVFYANGKKTVTIKYLTAEEDDILFSPELIKSGKQLDALLQTAVIDKDLRPDDMVIGDKNVVLVALRRTGLGDIYNPGATTCPSCKEEFNPDVDLSKLKVKNLEVMPDSNGEYDYTLPVMKVDIKFKLLKGGDENILEKKANFSNKKNGSYKVTKYVTERYRMQIMEVNGKRDKTYISNLITKMPMLDSHSLREYIRIVSPGLDLDYTFECKNCGHVYEEEVQLNYRLFYPNANV